MTQHMNDVIRTSVLTVGVLEPDLDEPVESLTRDHRAVGDGAVGRASVVGRLRERGLSSGLEGRCNSRKSGSCKRGSYDRLDENHGTSQEQICDNATSLGMSWRRC